MFTNSNLEGIRSTINGHIWGTYSKSAPGKGSNSFGDEKAMDTWTYIYDAFVEKEMDITVKMADLAVEFSNPQNKKIDLGELIHYEIKISNYGPSDVKDAKFDFKVPEGFKVESIAYTGGCGLVQNPNKYNALIDLPAHCEIFLKIMLKANKVADHVYGKVRAEASILRPADVIDPDATSVKPFDGKPRTAQGECLNNGLQVACNNIAYHADYFLLEPPGERGALFLIKEALHIDANRDQFAQEGEIVKYTFTIINSGLVNVSELKLIDPMLSASPLTLLNNSMPANDIQILTVDYVIKKSDLDRGYVTNSALISGLNPRGFEVSDRSGISTSDDIPTTISLPKKPQIALIKSVMNRGTANNGLFTLGDIITYEFQIRHKGDYAVENLMFSDPNISKDYIPLPKYSIHNETIRFQLNYVVTDNDIDAGYVKNSATVTGFDALYSTKQTDVSGLTFDDNEPTIVYTPTRIKAQDDVAKVYENESVIIDVLMNDQKGSSPIVKSKIKFIQLPTNGNVVANPDGSILYTPYNEYFGADGFTYQVADENGLWSTIAFVAVTVLEAIPRAVDDFVETYYNRSVDIHVLANDKSTGVNIDYNSVEIISFPQLGTLVHLGNGVFTYSPNRFTTGVDYFTYTVKDVNGGVSNIAMVTITIHGFLIPNVFTPNDDGYNDKFKILGTHTFDQTALTVIDKYGIMMYQSQDYRNDWHGDNLTDGTYFVLIEGYVEGQKTFTHKGTITIIRKITY